MQLCIVNYLVETKKSNLFKVVLPNSVIVKTETTRSIFTIPKYFSKISCGGHSHAPKKQYTKFAYTYNT